MALSKERVLQRWFDCWCPKFFLATGPGCGAMDSNYLVFSCEYSEPWWEHSVALKGTQGIIAQKKEAQRKGREEAKKLKPGTFIAVQDRSSQEYTIPFMIGITLDTGHGASSSSSILYSLSSPSDLFSTLCSLRSALSLLSPEPSVLSALCSVLCALSPDLISCFLFPVP